MSIQESATARAGQSAHPAFSAFGASNAGNERDNNEDAFAVAPQAGLCIVADGMGGLERGEVASREAVSLIQEACGRGVPLAEAFHLAHDRVKAMADAATNERMGATVVAASISGSSADIVWVGDSRAYLWRDGELKQLTRDHTFVQELISRGVIDEAEAASHPNRSIVTRALGVREIDRLEVGEARVDLKPGDRLLLCTDGLSSYLEDAAIAAELAANLPDTDTVNRLIERTLTQTEAADNVTIVVASVPR